MRTATCTVPTSTAPFESASNKAGEPMSRWAGGAFVVALLTAVLVRAQPAPLRVIASNGVKTFVEALVPAYEKSSGRKTSITYGTSTTLVKNIVGGERFDVVIATAEAVEQI